MKKKAKRKAQSAMEYLMTYGWAILIVIIVAAALYALGVFNPATWTGHSATGFGALGVPSDWVYSNTTYNITIRNGLGETVTIHNVTARSGTSSCNLDPNQVSATLGAGATKGFGFSSCPALTSGSSYSVAVSVTYITQSGIYNQTVSGTTAGSVA
jgi:hypothetical protein